MALTFEWEVRKAAANLAKHGVSFDEALTVFADPLGRLEEDDRHSVLESRLVLLGSPRLTGYWPSCSLNEGLSGFV